MDFRCPKQSTRTTSRQQIGKAFTPKELQQVLSQLSAVKAAGPDLLKHLSSKRSSVQLNILDSIWLSSWRQQSSRSTYVVSFFKKVKDPADVGSYRPTALNSTIGKALENSLQTACHGGLRNNLLAVKGKQVSVRDVVPPNSASGYHNSSLIDFSRHTIATFFDFSRA